MEDSVPSSECVLKTWLVQYFFITIWLVIHCEHANLLGVETPGPSPRCNADGVFEAEYNRSSKQYWQSPWGGSALCSPGAVCTTQLQCVASGGTALSYCSLAYYTGVCCVKYEDCGRTANTQVAYFRNPRYPSADHGSMNCVFSLVTANSTCGVRVDFLEAIFAPSIDDGCYQDIVTILNLDQRFTGFNTPYCGLLQGYSTVLVVPGPSQLRMVVTLQNTRGSTWNVRLTQISCQKTVLQGEDACGISNAAQGREETASNRKAVNDRFLADNENNTQAERRSILAKSTGNGISGKLVPPQLLRGKFKKPTFPKKINISTIFEDSRQMGDGEVLQKIIGGAQSSPHQFPWMAVLLLDGSLHCGGSLISRLWVLTAAHCTVLTDSVVPAIARLQVALGVHNLSEPDDPRRAIRFISNIVRHPEYHGGNNDISLIQLSEPVRYSSAVRPICLPSNPARTYAGMVGVIAGWGSTAMKRSSDVLLFAPIPALNNSFCGAAWAALGVGIQAGMLCAGLGGTATCLGDSGGPLMAEEEDGLYVIAGITSFGAPPTCGSLTYPDVWTRVSSYLDWITLALVDLA